MPIDDVVDVKFAKPFGRDGINAFGITAANFNQPPVNSNVDVVLSPTADWVAGGQCVWIEGGGLYRVVDVNSGAKTVTLTLLATGTIVYPDPVPAGSKCSPSGEPGGGSTGSPIKASVVRFTQDDSTPVTNSTVVITIPHTSRTGKIQITCQINGYVNWAGSPVAGGGSVDMICGGSASNPPGIDTVVIGGSTYNYAVLTSPAVDGSYGPSPVLVATADAPVDSEYFVFVSLQNTPPGGDGNTNPFVWGGSFIVNDLDVS